MTQRGGDLAELRDRLARAHQRAGRPQRRRQVHAGQRAGARRRTATSASSTRSPAAAGTPRPRRSCWRCPTARRLDHRHARASGRSGSRTCSPEDLIEAFPDLDEMTEDCPRGCTHGADEPECGLDEAVARGRGRPRAGRVVPAAARRPQRAGVLTDAPSQTARAPASPVRNTQTSTTHGTSSGRTPTQRRRAARDAHRRRSRRRARQRQARARSGPANAEQ